MALAIVLTSSNFFAERVATIIKSGFKLFNASRLGSKTVPILAACATAGFKCGNVLATSGEPATATPKCLSVVKHQWQQHRKLRPY